VLRYGVGVSYLALETCHFRVQPVAEVVGWTFLSGKVFSPDVGVRQAEGETIVNSKLRVRFCFGQSAEPGLLNQSDIAVSYGRALTGDVLYKDIFRVELRLRF